MNGPQTSPIILTLSDSIAIVTFNRASERNPLSTALLNELDQLLRQLGEHDSLRAIIFTGSQDVFLSGANIRELATMDQAGAQWFSQRGQALMQRIADANQVTIAAINGYCMGGGLDFALACDLRIASYTAVFAHPGARLGIITGWGGTQRLPRLIGRAKALELLATSRPIDATEAKDIGLVHQVQTPPLDFAITLARSLP